MPLPGSQSTEDVQKDLKLLSSQLENLRKLYEQYFLGIVREEPFKLRSDVQKLISKHVGISIQNASLKFMLQQSVSRYNTYSAYWDRILREMEAGTYKRDVFKTDLHEKERTKTGQIPAAKPASKDHQDVFESLFDEYRQLRTQLKQDTKNLSFDNFKNQLASKMKELGEKGEKFSFKIVQEEQKIKIKLQKKKGPKD